jgi:hypothetical protein
MEIFDGFYMRPRSGPCIGLDPQQKMAKMRFFCALKFKLKLFSLRFARQELSDS